MKLSTEEIRILRRELVAVRGLIDKGLISGVGSLTAAGERWLVQDKERIRQARSEAGKKGGPARADALSRRERVRIATQGSRAAVRARRKSDGKQS
jgi:hypothetical protein